MATLSALAITFFMPVGLLHENKIVNSNSNIIGFVIFYVNIKKATQLF
jgi:hypothetical protein